MVSFDEVRFRKAVLRLSTPLFRWPVRVNRTVSEPKQTRRQYEDASGNAGFAASNASLQIRNVVPGFRHAAISKPKHWPTPHPGRGALETPTAAAGEAKDAPPPVSGR